MLTNLNTSHDSLSHVSPCDIPYSQPLLWKAEKPFPGSPVVTFELLSCRNHPRVLVTSPLPVTNPLQTPVQAPLSLCFPKLRSGLSQSQVPPGMITIITNHTKKILTGSGPHGAIREAQGGKRTGPGSFSILPPSSYKVPPPKAPCSLVTVPAGLQPVELTESHKGTRKGEACSSSFLIRLHKGPKAPAKSKMPCRYPEFFLSLS